MLIRRRVTCLCYSAAIVSQARPSKIGFADLPSGGCRNPGSGSTKEPRWMRSPKHGYEPTREAAMAAFRQELAAGEVGSTAGEGAGLRVAKGARQNNCNPRGLIVNACNTN